MDIQAYIQSGILEQYCLDLLNVSEQADVLKNCALFPEIKQELINIENTIEKMVKAQAIIPDERLKQKILSKLGFGNEIALNNLPIVNAYADYKAWLKAVEHLVPAQPFDDFFAEVLRQDDQAIQMLVVTKIDVPEETHDNWIESFFILEGQCVCTVGAETITLNAGDFLEVPLYTEHDIKITSPHVVAILQRLTV
jgi:mannose-6-phosphate isomerase-like protein (cupin superfamily)